MWLLGLSTVLVGALSFTPQRLHVDGRIVWVEASDLDGDGGADLVAMFRRGGRDSRRFLAVFIQKPDGRYPEKPNDVRQLPQDAAIATVADCDGNGSGEVVLMTASGITAFAIAGGKFSPEPLSWISAPTAAMFADRDNLPLWGLCGDFHRSHQRELALWGVGALSFYRAAGGKWTLVDTLRIAPEALTVTQPTGTFRGSAAQPDISLATTFRYPELSVGDYNGDGKADLFVFSEERLRIHGGDGTRYSERPIASLDFEFRTIEEHNKRNTAVIAQALDLNGDGKTDYALNKVTGSLMSLRSETAIHLNEGGFTKKPSQLIKRDGFSVLAQFIDLNGDGRLEMIEGHSDIGILGVARALVSRKLTIDALVTQNHGGVFDLANTKKFNITLSFDFSGGPFLKGPIPHVSHDLDGDRALDFLSSPDGQTLQIFRGTKDATFDPDAALKLEVEISPFTAPFFDARSKRAHIVTFFRDMDGKEGRILVLLNTSS